MTDRERRSSDRKRSRSPYSHRDSDVKRHRRSRSRSPYRKHRPHSKHHRENGSKEQVPLPYQRHALDKRDLGEYKALFSEYLDIQKSIDIDDLSRDEVKGRWKSFLGKWNRGQLAEGWYDPDMKKKADARYQARPEPPKMIEDRCNKDPQARELQRPPAVVQGSEDEDDEFGPSLPNRGAKKSGPGIPSLQDLQHRRELADEDSRDRLDDLRYDRKVDRAEQKSRLEELVPRADPGSRERLMEKKADKTSVLHASREAKEGGEADVKDSDLMGGDEGEGFKAELKKRERVKNEREVRREEQLRARAEEREERMRGVREKEAKTMEMLKNIARERFG